MRQLLKKWWEGEYIPPINDPYSGVFMIQGTTKWHWTAKLARWCVEFYGREWKWTLGSAAALVAFMFFRN